MSMGYCRNCGAPLPAGNTTYCSKDCQRSFLSDHRPDNWPRSSGNYDYSTDDPEDDNTWS